MTTDISKRFFEYVDARQSLYIEQLAEAVGIPSVSSDLANHLDDIVKMMNWTKERIEKLGGKVTMDENPANTEEQKFPPLLLGEFGSDPAKKTLCIYAHLDVQPAAKEDGWDTDPFVLTEKDGKLYGRGSTDDKGPALSWLWVVEAFQELGIELPVNIKLLYEGMEESGSTGLGMWVEKASAPGEFLDDVDFFCISDSYWLGKTKPCLTYGLRGLAYFELSVEGVKQDLHSGVFGGVTHEAMTDLVRLMGTLVDSCGNIQVDGIMDDVRPVTPEEVALYEAIEFDPEAFKEEVGVASVSNKLAHEDKTTLLMKRWRYPTLSLHGIEGAFSGSGAKTVIPAKVIGKFSLRLVPDQKPSRIETLVRTHLEKEFAKMKSPNKMKVSLHGGAPAWIASPDHPSFSAAASATERVYGVKPDYIREGGSIPIASLLENATGMSVLLLPIGACDDMAHSQNEKYNISNLMNGIKVLGLYMDELGKVDGPNPSSCRCLPMMLSDEELMVPGAFMRGFKCQCEM